MDDIVKALKNDKKIEFPNGVSYLSIPQRGDEISGERNKEDKEYLHTQLKNRSRGFETIQNIENKESKNSIYS